LEETLKHTLRQQQDGNLRDRPRRDHLAIEGIHRIEDLGLDRRAHSLGNTFGEIQAKRHSDRNNQGNFLTAAGCGRRRRKSGE